MKNEENIVLTPSGTFAVSPVTTNPSRMVFTDSHVYLFFDDIPDYIFEDSIFKLFILGKSILCRVICVVELPDGYMVYVQRLQRNCSVWKTQALKHQTMIYQNVKITPIGQFDEVD